MASGLLLSGNGGLAMFENLTVAAIAMIAAEIVVAACLIGMFFSRPRHH